MSILQVFVGAMALLATPVWGLLGRDPAPMVEPGVAPLALAIETLAFVALIYGSRSEAPLSWALIVAIGLAAARFICCLTTAGLVAVIGFEGLSFGPLLYQLWLGFPLAVLAQVFVTMQVFKELSIHYAPGLLAAPIDLAPSERTDTAIPSADRGRLAGLPHEAPPAREFGDLDHFFNRLPSLLGYAIYTSDGFLVKANQPNENDEIDVLNALPRLIASMETVGGESIEGVQQWLVETDSLAILGSRVYPRFRLIAFARPRDNAESRERCTTLFRQCAAGLLRRRYGRQSSIQW